MRGGTITYSSCAGNTESGFKHVTYSRVFPKYIIIMLSGDKRLYSSYIVVCLAELHTDTISTNLLTKYRANTHDVQNILVCMKECVYLHISSHVYRWKDNLAVHSLTHTRILTKCIQLASSMWSFVKCTHTYVCVVIVVVSGENEFKIRCIPYHRWGNRTL